MFPQTFDPDTFVPSVYWEAWRDHHKISPKQFPYWRVMFDIHVGQKCVWMIYDFGFNRDGDYPVNHLFVIYKSTMSINQITIYRLL